MSSIKLSPEHGVNPTIPVCFFCGKPKNEIALLGKIGGRNEDIEAPMHTVLNYEPCEECEKLMNQGITLMGTSNYRPDKRPSVVKDQEVYPTGSYLVVSEGLIRTICNNPATADGIIKSRKAWVDQQIIDNLEEQYQKMQEKLNNE
jgi:hypothetical protein